MLALVPKFYNILKKVCIVFTVFMVLLTLLLHFFQQDKKETFARQDQTASIRDQVYKTINDPELKKTKDGKNTIAIYKVISCSIIGEGCTNNPSDGNKYFSRSLFGGITNAITFPFMHPAASGTWWVHNNLQNAGFVPQTYAAEGLGFSSLKALFSIWKIFRDLAYIFIVVIMITIGFLIIFRVNLGSNTVISIENSLPRIVLSLILITFSFAIAGFLIDMMYVSMAIIISIFSPHFPGITLTQLQNKYLTASPGVIFESLNPTSIAPHIDPFWTTFFPLLGTGEELGLALGNSANIAQGLLRLLPGTLQGLLYILGGVATLFLGAQVNSQLKNLADTVRDVGLATVNLGGLISGLLSNPVAVVMTVVLAFVIVPILIMIAILLTMLFLFVRIFFILLAAYLRILFYVIFGPVFMLMNALPGQNTFGFWFKSLVGDLITFPLVTLLFFVGNLLVNSFMISQNPGLKPWSPPYLSGIDEYTYAFLLSMGLLFSIPEIIKFTKAALDLKDPPLSVGVGTFFSGFTVPGSRAVGLATQAHAVHGVVHAVQQLGGAWTKKPGGSGH